MQMSLLFIIIAVFSSVYADEKLKINELFSTGGCMITAAQDDLVTFRSYGYTEDGRQFDAGDWEILLGRGEAPKGIEQGLMGLCYGDERSLRIHSDLAYGEEGLKDRVPPNSTVIYDVEVLSIERKEQKRVGLHMNQFLKFEDTNVVEDCGMKVEEWDRIRWHYIGTLADPQNTHFDSGDFKARINNGDVIKGVNEAMKGLCVGGKRKMRMHSSLAYKDKARGNIPAYANLNFEVFLKSIDREGEGWEDLDVKMRRSVVVSKENPIKITDYMDTGKCKVKIEDGDVVTLKRHSYFLDGKLFDVRQIEKKIRPGDSKSGLEKGLVGLCVGDERSMVLHPDLAYGANGVPRKVPMNATIILDIVILDIVKYQQSEDAYEEVEEETGLKPGQKLKIETIKTIDNCTMKSKNYDIITWNYIGTLLDGTEFARGPYKAALGKNQIIYGVDRGMRDMCVGEKRRLTMHWDWAYGDEGTDGIPPKSTLIFENELTHLERPPSVEEEHAEL